MYFSDVSAKSESPLSNWTSNVAGLRTIGVRTAMLNPRGRKYLFAPAIICQVYLLVDSQSSISLYSFKICNLNLIMCSQLGIFLNEICDACKCIKLYSVHLRTHIVLHSWIAGQLAWRTQNAPKKFLTIGASPRTQLGKLTALLQTPQLVGSGGKPPLSTRGLWFSPLGFEFRPRNVDFIPTPLLWPRGLVYIPWCGSTLPQTTATLYYNTHHAPTQHGSVCYLRFAIPNPNPNHIPNPILGDSALGDSGPLPTTSLTQGTTVTHMHVFIKAQTRPLRPTMTDLD